VLVEKKVLIGRDLLAAEVSGEAMDPAEPTETI
jgi:hypothetical protein